MSVCYCVCRGFEPDPPKLRCSRYAERPRVRCELSHIMQLAIGGGERIAVWTPGRSRSHGTDYSANSQCRPQPSRLGLNQGPAETDRAFHVGEVDPDSQQLMLSGIEGSQHVHEKYFLATDRSR